MAEEIEITPRIERIIWRGAGNKSARQMAEETGLDPEDILRIKEQMLSEVDILTIQQRRQKTLINLEQISNEAWEDAKSVPVEFKAGMYNSAIAAQKELVRQLKDLQAEETGAVEKLNEMRVRELIKIVEESAVLTFRELAIRYELDEEEMTGIFRKNMLDVAARRELN